MKTIDFLIYAADNIYYGFWSTERPLEKATKGEMKRWCDKGSVIINNLKPKPFDNVDLPVKEFILHPKGKKRTTLF